MEGETLLVALAQNGHIAAFGQLLRRVHGQLRSVHKQYGGRFSAAPSGRGTTRSAESGGYNPERFFKIAGCTML